MAAALLLDVVRATQCYFQKFHLRVARSSPRLVAYDEYHSVRVVVGVEEWLSQRCDAFLVLCLPSSFAELLSPLAVLTLLPPMQVSARLLTK